MRAIVMRQFGDPGVLRLEETPDPIPRAEHSVVNVTLAGVNLIDAHVRTNSSLPPVNLPYTPGREVVGTREDGRRVVALTKGGGYAEKALVHRNASWEVPDDLRDDQAAALALQGNTAWHLLFTTVRVVPGERLVISAAGDGVGILAVQLAHQLGAKVIALAGTPQRRELAMELGADAVVDSSSAANLTERIKDAADGPVHAALEMTGGKTFDALVAALARGGRIAVYGHGTHASGTVSQVSTQTLIERSISASGFCLSSLHTGLALPISMKALFAAVRHGTLRLVTDGTYALSDAAQAHRDLETRSTAGKLMLDTTR